MYNHVHHMYTYIIYFQCHYKNKYITLILSFTINHKTNNHDTCNIHNAYTTVSCVLLLSLYLQVDRVFVSAAAMSVWLPLTMAALFSVSQVTVILTSVVIRAAIVVLVCALTSLSGRVQLLCYSTE